MRVHAKKRFILCIMLTVSVIVSGNVFANVTSLTNLVLSPAAPSPGQAVNVSWDYINDYGPEPEKYFIAVTNACTLPATGGGNLTTTKVLVGDACAAPTPATNCLSCVAASGCDDLGSPAAGTHTVNKSVNMPSSLIPGYTYYLNVGMASYNVYMNPDLMVQRQACAQFVVPLTAPYINLRKTAEGTTGSVGTEVLFTIYYDAGNVHNFRITDAVDSRFTIKEIYNGGTAVGQNITWIVNAGYITSPVQGSVSFLAEINSGTAGTLIPNTAVGTANEISASNSNAVNVAIGQPGLTVSKSVSHVTAAPGTTITYTMQYSNLGTTLVEYENFEAGIPAGWSATGGTWVVNSGVLEQTGAAGYTSFMDNNITPLHDGIYVCDMLIPSSNTAHMDGVLHFIQVDSNNFYMARINASDNRLYLDKVVAGTSSIGGTSVANPHGLDIMQDIWYTLKVQVCGSSIMMKVWPRGNNEHPSWDLNVTDTGIPGNGIVGFQANEGPQKYDNLKVFSLTASSNPRIFDSVPAGIVYAGCGGGTGCSKPGSVVNWSLGSTCAGAQAVSWWGYVSAGCGSYITNTAGIDSDDSPPPVFSNNVITGITGCTPTITPSATNTQGATFTLTATRTATQTSTQTLTLTQTLTQTRTITPTATQSVTATVTSVTNTQTPSATQSITLSATPSLTQTRTNTPTLSVTQSITLTNTTTITFTNTPTVTRTATASVTDTVSSNTPTNVPSSTDTPTITPSCTATQSFTPTASATATLSATPSITVTATASITDTISSNTPTNVPSFTNTPTASQTASGTPSSSATMTNTPTATGTFTYTATDTVSSNTPTVTGTPTRTFTQTPSVTHSITPSVTGTVTATATLTCTFTATLSITATASVTPTVTQTPTPPASAVELELILTARGDDPAPGAIITYRLMIKNNGYAAVSNIKIYDTLPSELVFEQYTGTGALITVSGNYLEWDFGPVFTLNPGDTYILEFEAKMLQKGEDGSLVTNTIYADYNDPFYSGINGRHPKLSSNQSFYPEGEPAVYPNPFDRTKAIGGMLKFFNLAPRSSLQIYTVSGEQVFTGNTQDNTFFMWNAKNNYGKYISPGIYYWVTVNRTSGNVKKGKIFVIK